MSYDIGLYEKQFLKEAIERDLGDWTNATVIPTTIREAVVERLKSLGYKLEFTSDTCQEWIHPKEEWGLQVSVFNSEIAFSIPYWDDWENAVMEADGLARKIAEEFGLGMHDPQNG